MWKCTGTQDHFVRSLALMLCYRLRDSWTSNTWAENVSPNKEQLSHTELRGGWSNTAWNVKLWLETMKVGWVSSKLDLWIQKHMQIHGQKDFAIVIAFKNANPNPPHADGQLKHKAFLWCSARAPFPWPRKAGEQLSSKACQPHWPKSTQHRMGAQQSRNSKGKPAKTHHANWTMNWKRGLKLWDTRVTEALWEQWRGMFVLFSAVREHRAQEQTKNYLPQREKDVFPLLLCEDE